MTWKPIAADIPGAIPLIGKLNPTEARDLGTLLQPQRARRGQVIVREGERERSLYFIFDGKAKVCHRDSQGKEVIMALLGAGDYFGEIALLAETPRSHDVIALEDCRLLVLTQHDFIEHARTHRGLTLLLAQSLALRLRATALRCGDLALLNVHARLARILLELSVPAEYEGQRVSLVRERPTHSELAGMVGTSREAVTRAFRALEDEGHVIVDKGTVIIRSLPLRKGTLPSARD